MKLGAYTIKRELTLNRSYLANDLTGHKVVLKILPSDCLLEGQLNPTVADRLRRVREIAMTEVANLRGVERDGDRVFLVWDYVEGEPFDPSRPDARQLAQELIHVLEHFHTTGLVHGAIHERNVLVDPNGAIKLIDVSPLLFLDPRRDQHAVAEMCRRIPELALIDAARTDPAPPRTIVRRQTVWAAFVLAMLGAVAAIGIHRLVQGTQPQPASPPKMAK